MPKWGQWCSAVDQERPGASLRRKQEALGNGLESLTSVYLRGGWVSQSAGILKDYDEGGEREKGTTAL